MQAAYDPPIVCLSNDGRYSLVMQAGILVHEAAHVKADKQRQVGHAVVLGNVPADSSPLADAEQRACDRIAAEAMRQLGLPANELATFLDGPHTGSEAIIAMLAGVSPQEANLMASCRSNRAWSPIPLKDAEPALWKEWDALRRGALPAPPRKSSSPTGSSAPPATEPTNGIKATSL
jgi:hypothetical protein